MNDVYTPNVVEKKKYSPVLFIVLALFLLSVVFLVINLTNGRTVFFGRASSVGVLNPANSYIFASPLMVRTGGDKIRITIFAIDGQGKGIPNKNVTIDCREKAVCQNAQVLVSPVQQSTDNLGQSMFDISSPIAGKFEFEAFIEGTPITQTVTLSFQ